MKTLFSFFCVMLACGIACADVEPAEDKSSYVLVLHHVIAECDEKILTSVLKSQPSLVNKAYALYGDSVVFD